MRRTAGHHPSSTPKHPVSTAAPAGSPAPRAAATNATGTSSSTANSPTLYVAGRSGGPPTSANSSAGRLPPSNTGVFGYPAWNAGS
jgi:hypothetical protein